MPELPTDGKTRVNEKIAELSVRGVLDDGKIGKTKTRNRKTSAKQKKRAAAAKERAEQFLEVLDSKKQKSKDRFKAVKTYRKREEEGGTEA